MKDTDNCGHLQGGMPTSGRRLVGSLLLNRTPVDTCAFHRLGEVVQYNPCYATLIYEYPPSKCTYS